MCLEYISKGGVGLCLRINCNQTGYVVSTSCVMYTVIWQWCNGYHKLMSFLTLTLWQLVGNKIYVTPPQLPVIL